ncbi:hypothetical protein [Microcoleus sp. N9_B4]|uniref:hypothetical protein n=1 Tax=Microcoleus sp. N9_B4 TaxID=3055386 RepID=UPI004040BA7E
MMELAKFCRVPTVGFIQIFNAVVNPEKFLLPISPVFPLPQTLFASGRNWFDRPHILQLPSIAADLPITAAQFCFSLLIDEFLCHENAISQLSDRNYCGIRAIFIQ